jgi:RNA polymerase sigma-70 factor, ECF subfamily
MDTVTSMANTRPSVEALYRADAERLWRAIYAYCGDPEIASDSVNEAYAQVMGRGDAVRDPAAWVWRTGFALARGALKARQSDERMRATERPTAAGIDRYADPDLLAALRRLPDGQRAVLILFYYADLPVRQIADRLGTNSLAVRATLTRGRRRLRQLLGDADG